MIYVYKLHIYADTQTKEKHEKQITLHITILTLNTLQNDKQTTRNIIVKTYTLEFKLKKKRKE